MANEEHVAILNQGVKAWNRWREENRDVRPHLISANLRGADLSGANLVDADLCFMDLVDADLSDAVLYRTMFAYADLAKTKGLDSCHHGGPSAIDHRTLQHCGPLPLSFLQGVGLSGYEIEFTKLYHGDLDNDQVTNIAYEIARIRIKSSAITACRSIRSWP